MLLVGVDLAVAVPCSQSMGNFQRMPCSVQVIISSKAVGAGRSANFSRVSRSICSNSVGLPVTGSDKSAVVNMKIRIRFFTNLFLTKTGKEYTP